MKFLLSFLILFFYTLAIAQYGEKDLHFKEFRETDSLALSVKYNGDIAQLTYVLTNNCDSQLEKTRAIFMWITHNIAYDYKLYNKKKNKRPGFKCRKKINCNAQYVEWKARYLKKIVSRKKAICSGYARLFETMCGYAGIQCSVVYGYTKNEPGHVGKMGILDHDWNTVLIDGNYYFLDATWAAGGCSTNKKGKLNGFKYNYDNYYWLTSVDKLSRNHFPKDTTWVRHTTYAKAKEDYKNTPYINGNLMDAVEVILPHSGVINAKLGDTIRFNIQNARPVTYIQAVSNLDRYRTPEEIVASGKQWNEEEIKKQKYLPYSKVQNFYSFYVIADNKKLKHYDIMFNHKQSLRFKINIIN